MNLYLRNKQLVALAMLALSGLTATTLRASSLTVNQAMNLETMLEASNAALTTVQDFEQGTLQNFNWSGTFSDQGWSFIGAGTLAGKAVALSYSGMLTGSIGQDVVTSFNGVGQVGKDPIVSITGQMQWFYDPTLNDYATMDFQQLTRIDPDSFWGWVAGAEAIGGGVIGGAADGAAVGAGTAGLGVAAGIAGGALAGAAAAVDLSAGVKFLLESDAPPPPPLDPPRPSYPTKKTSLAPTPGYIYNAVGVSSALAGSDLSGTILSTGTFDLASGTFQGASSPVPEPSVFTLLSVGVGALFLSRLLRTRVP
jgi:hypothetical protein